MEIYAGQRSKYLLGNDKFIPIYTDDYTLWVNDDPQAPDECREYARKVATILNTAPELLAALKELIKAADPRTNMSDIPLLDALSVARTAIARAEGGG